MNKTNWPLNIWFVSIIASGISSAAVIWQLTHNIKAAVACYSAVFFFGYAIPWCITMVLNRWKP